MSSQQAPGAQQTQANAAKPSLTGVRIKQRKGQARATAKFEPEAFRDNLLTYLVSLPADATPDQILAKLVAAGAQLELLKYSDAFFELLICGGLLQPGGSYLDAAGDETKRSKIAILRTKGTGLGDADIGDEDQTLAGDQGDWKKEIRDLVDVLKRLIQRYKYLQKPLDENSLPSLIAYIAKWDPLTREKLAYATACFVTEGLASGKCLQSLWRDAVVKDEVGLTFLTEFIQFYLASPNPQTIESFALLFRKSGLDKLGLINVFPSQVRTTERLEEHFKKAELGGVVDWYLNSVRKVVREEMVGRLTEMMGGEEDTVEEMAEYVKAQQNETKIGEVDLLQAIWAAIMADVDWTAKPEQLEALALKNIKTYASLMEPFCTTAKAQVSLINTAQVYCYTETRIIKAFPQILKVLYNEDCISDQAIIYWAQKGASAQGKGHFVKAAEPLVKFLQAQDDDDEEDDE